MNSRSLTTFWFAAILALAGAATPMLADTSASYETGSLTSDATIGRNRLLPPHKFFPGNAESNMNLQEYAH